MPFMNGMEVQDSYSNRVVAFIDCLGFKQKIIDSIANPNLIARLRMLNFHLQAGSFAGNDQNVDFRRLQFSDSLVLSARANSDGLWFVVLFLRAVTFNVLHLGMLFRGAIAVGPMIHEGSIAFGPAYIEAYHLESSIALHPRIVLSRQAAELAQDSAKAHDGWETEYLQRYLRRDHDGVVYIEIFDDPRMDQGFASALSNKIGQDMHAELLNGLVCMVESEMARAIERNRPDIYSKHRWFGARLNGHIQCLADHLGTSLVAPVHFQDDRPGDVPLRNS